MLAFACALAQASTPAVVVSGGIGWLATANDSYIGENTKIAEKLGHTIHESSQEHAVPILTQGLYRSEPFGGWLLGVEATERWWRVWSEGLSATASSASHRIDRSVIAIDLQAKSALVIPRRSYRLVFGLGPALYWMGTREKGWFGNQSVIDFALGVRGSAGVRFAITERIGVVTEATIETFRVPQRNLVLNDGGTAPAFSLNLRLEAWL